MPRFANLNRYRLMSSAYSNSPHYSTLGLRFFGGSALRKSIIFPQHAFARFIFQAQALQPVAAEPDQKRHA